MANWKHRIALTDLWQELSFYDEFEGGTSALALAVHTRLEKDRSNVRARTSLQRMGEYDKVSDEFHALSLDPHVRDNEFEFVLSELYDWADDVRVWID